VKVLRDRAIIAVLLGCGLRRSEVAAPTVGHVHCLMVQAPFLTPTCGFYSPGRGLFMIIRLIMMRWKRWFSPAPRSSALMCGAPDEEGRKRLCLLLSGSRSLRMRCLNPRHHYPRTRSAIDPGASWRVGKRRKCGGMAISGAHRTPLSRTGTGPRTTNTLTASTSLYGQQQFDQSDQSTSGGLERVIEPDVDYYEHAVERRDQHLHQLTAKERPTASAVSLPIVCQPD
jgi:hypothetical protein